MQILTLKVSKITLFVTTCLLSFTFSSCNKAIQEVKPIAIKVVKESGKQAIRTATDRAVNKGIDSMEENKPNPVIAASQATPDKFIEGYYQLINRRQYQDAWKNLTPEYQNTSPDFNNFKQWWNQVDYATIIGTSLIQVDDSIATIDVNLEYRMKDGSQANDSSRITLIFSEGKWLIKDKIKI